MNKMAVVLFIIIIFCSTIEGQVGFDFVSSVLHYDELRSVAALGRYVYCRGNDGFYVMELVDQDSLICANYILQDSIGGILHDDNPDDLRLYTHYGNKLKYLDISDTLNPTLNDYYISDQVGFCCAHINNDIAYFGVNDYMWDGFVEVVDISDSLSPVYLTTLEIYTHVNRIYADDNYLYVLYDYIHDLDPSGIEIYEIDGPGQYSIVCNLFMYCGPSSIALVDNYLFASAYDGTRILDISIIEEPDSVGFIDLWNAQDMFIIDNTLFAITGARINMYDISDPTQPISLGYYSCGGAIRKYSLGGNLLYFTALNGHQNSTSALNLLDLTNFSEPDFIDKYVINAPVKDVQIAGEWAFVACGKSGLYSVYVSDPYNPVVANRLDLSGDVENIIIDNNHAYLSTYSEGLKIVDIQIPNDPQLISTYTFTDRLVSVTANDNLLYMVTANGGSYDYVIQILNISNPEQPEHIYTYAELFDPRYIIVEDTLAYISCVFSLEIVNMADPLNPIHLSSHPYRNIGYRTAKTDSLLFVSCSYDGLDIYDVSDPFDPYLISNLDSSTPEAVSIDNDYAYLSCYYGLDLVDFTNPDEPELLFSYPSITLENEVDINNEFIYAATGDDLTILKLTTLIIYDPGATNPDLYDLSQNYPNPFNASTAIKYELPYQSRVTIDIYDILGQKVSTLVDKQQQAGYHQVIWRADDFSSGMYFYKLQAGDFVETKKMLLLK